MRSVAFKLPHDSTSMGIWRADRCRRDGIHRPSFTVFEQTWGQVTQSPHVRNCVFIRQRTEPSAPSLFVAGKQLRRLSNSLARPSPAIACTSGRLPSKIAARR